MGGTEKAHCPDEDWKLFILDNTVCILALRKQKLNFLSSKQGLDLKVFANSAGMESRC